jgi:hypothetical protein
VVAEWVRVPEWRRWHQRSPGTVATAQNVTPGFKAKLNAHSMCAEESSLHTYRTENGYKITNVSIYSICYTNNVLQKTKLNTLDKIAAERHHNSTGNRSPITPHQRIPNLVQLLSSRFE